MKGSRKFLQPLLGLFVALGAAQTVPAAEPVCLLYTSPSPRD